MMNSELSHSQVMDMLPAYVLGVLEPEDMLVVHEYVQSHTELLPQLQELEQTIGQLAYAAPDVLLPADHKQRILARIQPDQPLKSAKVISLARSQPQKSVSWLEWLNKWRGGLLRHSLSFAVLLVVLFMAFYLSQAQTRLNEATSQIATLQPLIGWCSSAATIPAHS